MQIKINGEIQIVPEGVSTLSNLFNFLDLKTQGRIVELNGDLFKPDEFSQVVLKSGDTLEIIQFMGGGSFI